MPPKKDKKEKTDKNFQSLSHKSTYAKTPGNQSEEDIKDFLKIRPKPVKLPGYELHEAYTGAVANSAVNKILNGVDDHIDDEYIKKNGTKFTINHTVLSFMTLHNQTAMDKDSEVNCQADYEDFEPNQVELDELTPQTYTVKPNPNQIMLQSTLNYV